MMNRPAKCDMQIYTMKRSISFKIAFFILLQLKRKSWFSRFPSKRFYNIDHWPVGPANHPVRGDMTAENFLHCLSDLPDGATRPGTDNSKTKLQTFKNTQASNYVHIKKV